MANPSSTSSKRLVGLGLRGIHNSPPMQVTAQIKSVLSHRSPRTSPTLSSSPTSPKNTINANAASPTTTPMMPSSSSIPSKVTDVVPPSSRLRTWRSFQGNLVSANSSTSTNTNAAIGGTRSSPLVESFTSMGSDLSVPSATSGKQKGITRLTGPTPPKVNDNGDIKGATNKTPSETLISGCRETGKSKGTDGVVGIHPIAATNTCSGPGPGSGSRFCLGIDFDNIAVSPKGTHGDDTKDFVQHVEDPHEGQATHGDIGSRRQALQLSQSPSRLRSKMSSYTPTPIQQGLHKSGSTPCSSDSPRLRPAASPTISPGSPTHPFVDVPFPLHPEQTFRIHTSPLVGSPMNSTNVQLKKSGLSGMVPPPSVTSLTSSTLPTSVSCPFPSASSPGARLSPKLSSALRNLKQFTSTLPHRFSSSFSHTTSATALPRNSASNNDPELALSPNTQRRMYAPINDDMYKSPPTPCSRTSSPRLSSHERSPSSVNLLSSSVHWLRRNDKDEGDEGYREANYSTMCLPSSSPFLHRRASSTSPSPILSPGRIRSGYSSPAAKIETIFGPRECGVECTPDTRDYRCSYSKLRMSPSSLTPLEEDKSLDLNAFMDEIGSGSLDERERSSSNLSCGELNLDGSPTGVSRGKGGSQSVSGLPITSSPITGSGSGSGGLAFNPGSGTKTIATARAGLRRKVTGMGSPLAQCVATWESVADSSLPQREEVEFEGDQDHETPMSPVLMRAKDSLLLRDVQRKKRAVSISGDEKMVELMSQIIESIPISTSTLRGVKQGISPDRISSDSDATERASLLHTLNKTKSSSPNPFRSLPPTPLAEMVSSTPTAHIQPPETPTIKPSTRTASGSRDLDGAISPLQLSSPAISLTNIVKESTWVQAPLSASVSFTLDILSSPSEYRQQRATCV